MRKDPIEVPAIKAENEKNQLLIREKLIDAAEGRLITVVEEFEKAFDILGKYSKTVTVFGSARLEQDHPACRQAFAISWALAKHGYAIVSGGGHGVMEAANRGAKQAGGISIGFNIKLPMEQTLNDHTTENYEFEHFFGRKVAMTLDANGYVFCGGGFGTFDELFEITTLMQTGRIPEVPIILLGTDFWGPLERFINETMLERYGTISPEDIDLFTITDDIENAVRKIEEYSLDKAREQMKQREEHTKKLNGRIS
jgi:uncharacterized protein (TIGR00730 family)